MESGNVSPLPLYGLAGSFEGDRQIEGEGQDLRTIIHRRRGTHETLTVGVHRRAQVDGNNTGEGSSLSDELARQSMATTLVVDLPGIGNDVFDVAASLAGDYDSWQVQAIELDGQRLTGYAREYKVMWICYCLTTISIIYVLAPAALRPHVVKLRTLDQSEVRH